MRGGITLLIHVNVNEEVYRSLSKDAEELKLTIGDYVGTILTNELPDIDKRLEENKKQTQEIIKRNVELSEALEKMTKDNEQLASALDAITPEEDKRETEEPV